MTGSMPMTLTDQPFTGGPFCDIKSNLDTVVCSGGFFTGA